MFSQSASRKYDSWAGFVEPRVAGRLVGVAYENLGHDRIVDSVDPVDWNSYRFLQLGSSSARNPDRRVRMKIGAPRAAKPALRSHDVVQRTDDSHPVV